MLLPTLVPWLLTLALTSSSLASLEDSADLHNLVSARDGRGSIVTSPAGLKWYNPDLSCGGSGHNVSAYTCYSGPATSFPKESAWISFNDMWKIQSKYALTISKDTLLEKNAIRQAIIKISKRAKVDARVILAVVIHESFGDVNVGCTYSYGGVHNCGLMQSYNATDTTYNASQPRKSITQMIIDGTQGTASGPGLVQLFNDAPDTTKETNGNVFAVFRAYNSGTVNASDLSDGRGALPAYVSDMANYLQGWNGLGDAPDHCNFTTTVSIPTPCTSYVAAPTQTESGTTSNCCYFHTVESGDTCYVVDTKYGISFNQLRAWNTELDSYCSNLQLDYAYCVDSSDPLPTSTSTTTSTSTPTSTSNPSACTAYIPAPTTTRTGSTADCCDWYSIVSGDSCYSIDTAYGISFAQLQAWNTYIDVNCTDIWASTAVCVDSSDVVPSACTSYVPAPTTTQVGSTADCCEWYSIVGGDSCYSIDTAYGISFAELQAWNTYIYANCTNIWGGTAVCVDSSDPVPTHT